MRKYYAYQYQNRWNAYCRKNAVLVEVSFWRYYWLKFTGYNVADIQAK
jgi:hypothetical protein